MHRHTWLALGFVFVGGLAACSETDDIGQSSDDFTSGAEEFKEVVRPDEEAQFQSFMGRMNDIQRSIADLTGHPVTRGFHAKAHACVAGELRVLPDRDARARFGVFAKETSYPAWVRFSNGNGVIQADKKSDARGLAVKLVGVDGAKLLENDPAFPGERGAVTQDFLMTNKPRSTSRDSRGFMAFAKAGLNLVLLREAVKEHSPGEALDAIPGLASAFDDFLSSGTEDLSRFDLIGRARIRLENAKMLREILTQTKRRVDSMASEQYWSGSAYKLGPKAVKYTFRPCEDLHKPARPDDAPDDYLATELAEHLKQNTTCFDLYAQFQLDSDKQPIEDAFKLWDERDTPPLRIAQLLIPPTDLGDPGVQAETDYCETLAFTPWHGLTEHRPLGNINRARKLVLKASQTLRKDTDKVIDEATVRAPRLLVFPDSVPSAGDSLDEPGASGAPAPTPATPLGPCPGSEGTDTCDECVRKMCADTPRETLCGKENPDADCLSLVESLCKACEEDASTEGQP